MGFFLSILSFWMSLAVRPGKIVSILEKSCKNQRDNAAFISPDHLRVSCVQWHIHKPSSLRGYLLEMLRVCQEAVDAGGQLLILPEHTGLLPGALIPFLDRILDWALDGERPDTLAAVKLEPGRLEMLSEAFQNYLYEMYYFTFSTLARLLRVYIVAGSCLIYEHGRRMNRSLVFGPDGEIWGSQDKMTIMGLDKVLGVTPGLSLEALNLPFGKICILLGEDGYYFEYVKWAESQGIRLLCCPDLGSPVLRDLWEIRSQEYDLHFGYSCFSHGLSTAPKAAVLGSVPPAENQITDSSASVTARLRLSAAHAAASWRISPNHAFLAREFVQAYRGSSSMEIGAPVENPHRT